MKHIMVVMVVLALLLLVLKAWAGKITDDFEDGDFNGWNTSRLAAAEQAECAVEDGVADNNVGSVDN